MQRDSFARRLGRRWPLLVAVIVIGAAGFTVYRLHGIFASTDVTATPSGSDSQIVPFNPKHVVLDVFGSPGTTATVTYLDVHAQPQKALGVTLPWSYDAITTDPAVFVNVAAQANGDSIGCRITIDGEVKDEKQVNTLNAYTFCLDKSG